MSSDDPYGRLDENERLFKEKLGAKVIIERNKGHFTSDDDANALPKVLSIFKET